MEQSLQTTQEQLSQRVTEVVRHEQVNRKLEMELKTLKGKIMVLLLDINFFPVSEIFLCFKTSLAKWYNLDYLHYFNNLFNLIIFKSSYKKVR